MKNPLLKSVLIVLAYLPVIFLIFLIGLYPLMFFLSDNPVGIEEMKSQALLNSSFWRTFFYLHIIFGGLALLVGWIQFVARLRTKYVKLHLIAGKTYVFSVWLSGLGIAYIGFYAEGGVITFLGFMIGGVIWVYTTAKGYLTIRNGQVIDHQRWMFYSYAMCFGAVTLRMWMPILVTSTGDFNLSYQIVAWLSWVPNLTIVYFIKR